MTEEVRLMLEKEKSFFDEINKKDTHAYEQALEGTNKVYYMIWRDLLESFKNSDKVVRTRVRILQATSVTDKGYPLETRDDYDYYDEMRKSALSFNLRHDEKISFAFADMAFYDYEKEPIMEPVITRMLTNMLIDDGLTVTKNGSRLSISTSSTNFEGIIRKVNEKQKIIEKK